MCRFLSYNHIVFVELLVVKNQRWCIHVKHGTFKNISFIPSDVTYVPTKNNLHGHTSSSQDKLTHKFLSKGKCSKKSKQKVGALHIAIPKKNAGAYAPFTSKTNIKRNKKTKNASLTKPYGSIFQKETLYFLISTKM